MTIPNFDMTQLIRAGVHFGHHRKRWNPRMAPYIYGMKHDSHIINLAFTQARLEKALHQLRSISEQGGRILFVGCKRQAASKIAEAAKKCGQYYVNHRWLGGTLTNWRTVSQSIGRMEEIEQSIQTEYNLRELKGTAKLTKKEILKLERQREKLNRNLGGIRNMGGLPSALFVIDTNHESTAILEAKKLNIPVYAIVDSNASDKGVSCVIPGNDDAASAIELYCDLVAAAILDGLQDHMKSVGINVEEEQEKKARHFSYNPEEKKPTSQEEKGQPREFIKKDPQVKKDFSVNKTNKTPPMKAKNNFSKPRKDIKKPEIKTTASDTNTTNG